MFKKSFLGRYHIKRVGQPAIYGRSPAKKKKSFYLFYFLPQNIFETKDRENINCEVIYSNTFPHSQRSIDLLIHWKIKKKLVSVNLGVTFHMLNLQRPYFIQQLKKKKIKIFSGIYFFQ